MKKLNKKNIKIKLIYLLVFEQTLMVQQILIMNLFHYVYLKPRLFCLNFILWCSI